MKKQISSLRLVSLGLIIVLICFITSTALAQEAELPNAGTTPDSPFYFLERILESIGTFFTFGDLKKAERYTNLAAERLAEIQVVIEKGKPELAEKTLARYEKQLEKSIARAEKAMLKGKDFEKVMEAMVKAGKATSVHLGILTEVYEKVPEQAKGAVENAMKSSVKRHEKLVKALKGGNNLGDVPEEVSLPDQIPQEVRERIQTRAQQELQIEEFLKEPESMESIRNRCIEQGGLTEMCEKIPLKGFKSFKALEDFCLELGVPSETCAATETQCKEFGVTTADECFRLMTTATTEAYQGAELKIIPAPSLSEEEIPSSYYIENPPYYGETGWCWGSSAMMLMMDQGFNEEEIQEARALIKTQGFGGPPDMFLAFIEYDLIGKIRIAYSKNYSKESADFYNSEFLVNPEEQIIILNNEDKALQKLKELVSSDVLVAIVGHHGNHYMVVTGYDGNYIYINDPGADDVYLAKYGEKYQERTRMTTARFFEQWAVSGFEGGGINFPGDFGMIWLEK